MASKKRKQQCKLYSYGGGREIHKNGKPFIGITREGDTRPVVADRVAHRIVALLNKSCK